MNKTQRLLKGRQFTKEEKAHGDQEKFSLKLDKIGQFQRKPFAVLPITAPFIIFNDDSNSHLVDQPSTACELNKKETENICRSTGSLSSDSSIRKSTLSLLTRVRRRSSYTSLQQTALSSLEKEVLFTLSSSSEKSPEVDSSMLGRRVPLATIDINRLDSIEDPDSGRIRHKLSYLSDYNSFVSPCADTKGKSLSQSRTSFSDGPSRKWHNPTLHVTSNVSLYRSLSEADCSVISSKLAFAERSINFSNSYALHSVDRSKSSIDLYKPKIVDELKEKRTNLIFAPADIVDEIYEYARYQEKLSCYRPTKCYMKNQPDLTSVMRTVLVDWMVEVAYEYKLRLETLHLAVNYVDRFLSKVHMTRERLQLLGTTSLLVASKYEEIHPPAFNQFVLITDNTYPKEEVLDMELVLLDKLNFQLSPPTVYFFLNYFKRYNRSLQRTERLCEFLAELILHDLQFVNFLPSTIAASIVCIANLTTEQIPWPECVEKASRYCINDIFACMVVVLESFKQASNSLCKVVVEKYRTDEYCRVADLKPPTSLPPPL